MLTPKAVWILFREATETVEVPLGEITERELRDFFLEVLQSPWWTQTLSAIVRLGLFARGKGERDELMAASLAYLTHLFLEHFGRNGPAEVARKVATTSGGK